MSGTVHQIKPLPQSVIVERVMFRLATDRVEACAWTLGALLALDSEQAALLLNALRARSYRNEALNELVECFTKEAT